ncbi:MAG: hypothetical protein U9R57_00745 [Thermodesulfobacteriota bacterium]|nr:hypothetical protein [Thermodesulfobacteriota bacterium]
MSEKAGKERELNNLNIFRRNFFVSDTLKSFAYSLYVTVFKVLLAEQVSEARDSEGQERCSGYLMYVPKQAEEPGCLPV